MTAYAASIRQIDELFAKMQEDSNATDLLTESLKQAREIAQTQLDPALYKALSWPVDISSYKVYLKDFSRWIPQQSGDAAWTKPGTDEQQEVYDRLCHFYWLINQKVGPNRNRVVQSIPNFADWLVSYARNWGSFLDTTDSFSEEIMESFIKYSPEYRVEDSMIDGKPNAPSGWLTFNQFFGRELNPGLRPIADPADNSVVTSPADCTFRAKYDIGPDSAIPEITVKKTHKFANIGDLLEGSRYGNAFANGTFAHYFLGPYSYHRFHAPVAGIVRECYPVIGRVYLDVNITGKQFDAPDSSQGGYEFAQARGIITIDTTDSPFGDIGVVAVIPVGMCQVSSVNMTATVGSNLLKGDEFGYFLFGGSDIIVLFQEGVQPQIDTGSHYRHYGTQIASCRGGGQMDTTIIAGSVLGNGQAGGGHGFASAPIENNGSFHSYHVTLPSDGFTMVVSPNAGCSSCRAYQVGSEMFRVDLTLGQGIAEDLPAFSFIAVKS